MPIMFPVPIALSWTIAASTWLWLALIVVGGAVLTAGLTTLFAWLAGSRRPAHHKTYSPGTASHAPALLTECTPPPEVVVPEDGRQADREPALV